MIFYNYYESVGDGIEYLRALGSIVGMLGLIVSLIFFIFGSSRARGYFLGVMVTSFILVGVCGLYTGIKYFRIY